MDNSDKNPGLKLSEIGTNVCFGVIRDRVRLLQRAKSVISDEPRTDAKRGLKLLADFGVRTLMLTGGNRRTAEAIGRMLKIEVAADLLPEDKQRIVERLRKERRSVAKIGDGINDAPALAAVDAGIAR